MKAKKYAICFNTKIQNTIDVKDSLLQIIQSQGMEVEALEIDNLRSGFDFAFVIGGDGTILRAARFFAEYGIPIFGVNLGRLGFLSQWSSDDLEEVVAKIINEHFHIEERLMLQSEKHFALNDFVVKGNSLARATKLTLKINGKAVCDYLADGLIISTATGSTAYGLSAGGPVIAPGLGVMEIVPICPHTMTARPLVISADSVISISMEDRDSGFVLSADGQDCFEVYSEIEIRKAPFKAKVALLEDFDFYSILRDKLHWGTSPAKI